MGKILVVDDDRMIRHLISQAFVETEHEVCTAVDCESGLAMIRDLQPDLLLLDIELPEISGFEAFDKFKALDPKLPIIYITGSGTSDTAIESMKLGAFDYLLKPLDVAQVRDVADRAIEIRRLAAVPVTLQSSGVIPADQGDQIVGRSEVMQEVFKAIGRVAPQNVTVLVRGESGTGKELIARAIYQHSDRRDGPFLAVNCAAIPEQLLESELFGHEQGAFTGADRQRIGKFEQCDAGTIFLDEIGDMPPSLQSKILRLLQEQEFQRVGGNETISTDVRIIAATNRNLEQMVVDEDFREDLLYRLNGYTINLPPLRDRGDDLTLLVQHFVARIAQELGLKIEGVSPAAHEKLLAYSWPGNIRELEGVVRQTLLQTTGSVVADEFLPKLLEDSAAQESNGHASSSHPRADLHEFIRCRLEAKSANVYAETLEMMERCLLGEILQATKGNQSEASRILGITRGSLRHKIRTWDIVIENRVEAG